jgi:hypothetical protein
MLHTPVAWSNVPAEGVALISVTLAGSVSVTSTFVAA